MKIFLFLGLTVCMAGCATSKQPIHSDGSVRSVLEQQLAAWNRGDLAGFMEGYAKSPQTRFASGGDVLFGWQTVFDRYKNRYGQGSGMGKLRFSDLDFQSLGPDAALAFGRWHLERDKETLSGLFTLAFRKENGVWRIFHDHTSSAAAPKPAENSKP
jgi:ketosteroid isomerase-like protein